MNRRKKTQGRMHVLAISFFVTFIALAGIYAAFYISVITPHIETQHLPESIPPYSSFWAKYVPANVAQFGFQNFTKIRLLNSSYPFPANLLELLKPADLIQTSDVNYFLTIVFAQPNITLDIAFLKEQSFVNFRATLLTESSFGEQVGNVTLYDVAVRVNTQPVTGWLVLFPNDRAVGFAAGATDAKQAVQQSLDSAANPSALSVLARVDITQTLYIVGGVDNHIGLGGENFPGVVKSGLMTVTSVDSSGPYIYVKNIVAFANSSAALTHYSDVTHGYLGSQKFVVYDSYVLAQEQDPLSRLGADYRLVL